ncbi:response regulator [soil metagenome]
MRMIFEQTMVASVMATVFAVAMALHLRPAVDDTVVKWWILAKILAVLPRLAQGLLFKRAKSANTVWMKWGRVMLFIDGLVWGSAGIFLMPVTDVTTMAVLVSTLCGVCAVASFVLHADWGACAAYTVPLLLPAGVFLVVGDHGSFGYYSAGSMMTFLALLLIAARRSERYIIEMLILRFNTDRITAKLATALQVSRNESRVKSEFLANMSHELRTPLHGILGLSRMLLKTSTRGRESDSLELIRRSGEHLLGLINGILDFSRLETQGLSLQREDFDIAVLIDDTTSMCLSNAMEKGLTLSCVVDLPRPYVVSADPSRVRQVLLNLIGNAIKFTDKGSIHVKVTEVGDDGAIVIRVEDSGIGIDPAEANRIFEPFVQADNSSRRRFGGTGLGLSISRRICRAMGGDISCTSVQGKGSTFICTLALERKAAPVAVVRPPLMLEELVGGEPDVERPLMRLTGRILLAEDNEVNAIVAHAILDQFGVLVERARNGYEVLERACTITNRPDLILMDCQMPEMDGYEASEKIREFEARHRLSRLPIVALTANALSHDRERCLEAGMDTYLSKPFAEADLQSILASYLLTPHGGRDGHDSGFYAARVQ